jgi:hypothetical protein
MDRERRLAVEEMIALKNKEIEAIISPGQSESLDSLTTVEAVTTAMVELEDLKNELQFLNESTDPDEPDSAVPVSLKPKPRPRSGAASARFSDH